MSDPGSPIDDALSSLDGTVLERIRDHVRFDAVDVDEYRETFLQAGFALPPSLEAFVSSRGLLRAADLGTPFELPSGSSGFQMAGPDELFAALLHLDDAIDAGVAAARDWLIIATVADDYDGAYALDTSGSAQAESPIGFYRQDAAAVGTAPAALPSPFDDFDGLIRTFADALRTSAVRGDRVGIANRMRALDRVLEEKPDWEKAWIQHERGKLEWSVDTARSFRGVLAHTDDETALRKILKSVHAVLEGRGNQAPDPELAEAFGRGSWPDWFPGPNELLARLPAEGPAGLRGVADWCLGWTGIASGGALTEAEELLSRMVASGGDAPGRGEILSRCAERAKPARGFCSDVDRAEAFHARALTWSLGRMTPRRVRHIASLTMQLHRLARTDAGHDAGMRVPPTVAPFGMPALFQKLSAIVQGRVDETPSLLREKVTRPAELPVHDALESWLAAHEGSQREKLKGIEAEWLDRLRGASAEDQAWVRRLLKKKINSKKLRTQRDALLAGLDSA